MKKIFYYSAIAICSVFTSCSNESDFSIDESNKESNCEFCSFDSIFRQDAKNYSDWTSSTSEKSCKATTRSSVNIITIYGYTSKKSGGNKKIAFGKDLLNLMKLPNQIYIAEYLTVNQDINISGLNPTCIFAPIDSPLCGLNPNSQTYERGYVSDAPDSNGNITLTTKCIHIISDLSGRSYNKWYPCTPEELQWEYKLINL